MSNNTTTQESSNLTEDLRRYARLYKRSEAIKSEMKEIASKAVEHLNASKTSRIIMECGTFSLTSRSSWVFSEDIIKLQDELDAKMSLEKVSGTAEKIEGPKFLRFQAKKSEP